MLAPGTVLLHDSLTPDGQSLLFEAPIEILTAHSADEARAALDLLEMAGREGLWAAGYFAYELGFLFEERLAGLLPEPSPTPLLWFGLYRGAQPLSAAAAGAFINQLAAGRSGVARDLTLRQDRAAYTRAFDAIKTYIGNGDVYQVNLTFKADFALAGDVVALYRDLMIKQPVAYGALIATSEHTILSRSPELFVENRAGALRARPMKGTLKRGRTLGEDDRGRIALSADLKSRAENLMIVDLLRNDLGRVATIGSVKVTDLFTVETYRSLHQMTSGITAQLRDGVSPLAALTGLFPCGSITGAPKIRAMEIIKELEGAPRGLYTGAIGHLAPDGDFCFNVAIRTAVINRNGQGEIGIGGAILADSDAVAEYDEALLKLKFFTDPVRPLALIETLLFENGQYYLLQRHLERLSNSARYFGLRYDENEVLDMLNGGAGNFTAPRLRVRLLLDEQKGLSLSATPLPKAEPKPFRFMLAAEPLDSQSPWLFHKTTHRGFYDAPRQAAVERHGIDDLVFSNERGELTEGAITTLFVRRRDGQNSDLLLTPALACGLLPGTLRAELLATGRAEEAILTAADLTGDTEIYLGNSVRGLVHAELMPGRFAEVLE